MRFTTFALLVAIQLLVVSAITFKKEGELIEIVKKAKSEAAELPSPPGHSGLTEDDSSLSPKGAQARKQHSAAMKEQDAVTTLYDDILLPFNPWRVIQVDRPKVWSVGEPSGAFATEMKKEFYAWWKETFPYGELASRLQTPKSKEYQYGKVLIHDKSLGERGDNTIQQKECKFYLELPKQDFKNAKKGEMKFADVPLTFKPFTTERASGCDGFEQLQFVNYYAGLLLGWMEKNQRIGQHIAKQASIAFELSLNVDIGAGYRARAGGWHVDAAYQQAKGEKKGTQGACAPLYFVFTDKFPTLFFTKAVAPFLEDKHLKRLKKHNCRPNEAFPGDTCAGHAFLMEAIGDTYQSPAAEIKFVGDDDRDKTEHVWDHDTTKGEPVPQFTQGYLNQEVLDGCIRPGGIEAYENVEGAVVKNANTITYKGHDYVFGPTDNPKGDAFRAHIKNHEKKKNLMAGAVVEAAKPWEMVVMEPYRLHNAGTYPKKDAAGGDITSMFKEDDPNKRTERFFVRIAVIPKDCTVSYNKNYKTSQQKGAVHNQLAQFFKQKSKTSQKQAQKTKVTTTTQKSDEGTLLEVEATARSNTTCIGDVCLPEDVEKHVLHTD